jgi:hypothetical protein
MEVRAVPAKLRPPSPETVPVRVMNKQIPTRFRVMMKRVPAKVAIAPVVLPTQRRISQRCDIGVKRGCAALAGAEPCFMCALDALWLCTYGVEARPSCTQSAFGTLLDAAGDRIHCLEARYSHNPEIQCGIRCKHSRPTLVDSEAPEQGTLNMPRKCLPLPGFGQA